MGIIAWIIIGLIAGALAKWIMPGDDPGGIIVTALIGMAGALVGGFIMQSILGFGSGGFIWSILVATAGRDHTARHLPAGHPPGSLRLPDRVGDRRSPVSNIGENDRRTRFGDESGIIVFGGRRQGLRGEEDACSG